MLRWFWRRRRSGETGAIAILTTVILIGAVLPLTALGASAYVRTSTAAELRGATDAGALSGAAEIPLVNLPSLSSLLSVLTSGPAGEKTFTAPPSVVTAPLNNGPRSDACTVALHNAMSRHGLGASFALPNGGLVCTASYAPPSGLLANLNNCITAVPALGPVLAPLINPLIGGLGALLPALYEPAIQTQLTWSVDSPFNGLIPGGGPRSQTVTSTANEVPKNLVVVPAIGPIDLNQPLAQVRQGLDSILGTIDALLSPVFIVLPACGTMLHTVQTLMDNLVDPPAQANTTLGAVLNSALASGQGINVVRSVVPLLGIPLLEFTEVQCPPGTLLPTPSPTIQALLSNPQCTLKLNGAFRSTLVRTSA